MAEAQGFEPWKVLPLPVFKTGAFNRSATLPLRNEPFLSNDYRSFSGAVSCYIPNLAYVCPARITQSWNIY